MNRRNGKLALLGAGLLAAFAACGGAQARLALFSTDWEDDGGASIARVWQRLGATKIRASTDVVVGVTGRSDGLIGLPLASGSKWTFTHPLDVRPFVAGTVVVGSGGGETFALDAGSGRVLWKQPTAGYTALGAGDNGSVTVLTFTRAPHSGGGSASKLLAVLRDGTVVREIGTNRALGVPAVLGSMAFVPWAGEYVSVVDLGSGDEVARVTLRSETSRAWTSEGALWFGEMGFIRFDDHIHDASRGRASLVTPPIRELPGVLRLMPPGGTPVPAVATAEDKARVYARPSATGPGVTIEDARWYATYFRIAMGYDAGQSADAAGDPSSPLRADEAGKLAWVHLHAVNFLGGAAGAGGLVLCDEQGKITSLDARTGGVLSEAELGEPVSACVVNVDAQRVTGPDTEAKPLAAQLAQAVLVDDPQLVVAQRLLLRELAAQEDETATRALVDLASDPRTSPDLLADARTHLANRRNGASYMETALLRHYDFLRDVLRAPPVGPIAQALGAMKEKTAAPLLAAHLFDPADTDDDVMRAAAALAVLAGPGEAPALKEFFGMYRATAANDDIAAAVVSVGQALLVVEDKEGRTKVESAAADATTVPYARDRLEALLSAAKQMAAGSAGDADSGGKKGK